LNQPLFTVATITYNSSKWVKQAIESVLASGFSDFEYIISDDCSTDRTWQIINSYNDPRIKAFHQNKNIGEYPNRNFALSKASGKYILYVDGDDELYADTLQKLEQYIKQYPEAGSIWGITEKYFSSRNLPLLLPSEEIIKWIYLANISFAQIGFAETVFRIDVLKNLGGFSEKFISGDTYIKKLIAVEEPVLLVPPGFVFWRITPGQASSKLPTNYNGYRNNVLIDRAIISTILKKNYKLPFKTIERNIQIRDTKLLITHTLKKGKVFDFFSLCQEFGFTFKDVKYLFKKGDYSYVSKVMEYI
jgi:glycosyltransferase involved in cell wall biosynthesis